VQTSPSPASSAGVIRAVGSVRPAVLPNSDVRHRAATNLLHRNTKKLGNVHTKYRTWRVRSTLRPGRPTTSSVPDTSPRTPVFTQTWQTLLSDSTQTGKCKGQQNPPIQNFMNIRSSGSPLDADPQTLYLHSCKLCLLMGQKAAFGANSVTPAEHKTGTGTGTGCSTNLRLELWLASVVPCVWYVPQGRSTAARLCCPRTHSE
jgi:hypothetical protein